MKMKEAEELAMQDGTTPPKPIQIERANGEWAFLFEKLKAENKELEAKLAEAQRIKVEYDRWLSNGVYYTYEEYERDIRPLLNQQAQLSEAQAEIERLRGALEKVFHTASPSASRNEWVCFKAADEALAKYAEGKDDGGRV